MGKEKGQKQHFIPKFFLENWTDSDGKCGFFRIDIPKLPYSRKFPKGQGFERGLYALKGVPEKAINIVEEKLFGAIDTNAAPVIDKLLGDTFRRPSAEELGWLTIFLASLEMRSPKNISKMKSMMRSLLEDDPYLAEEIHRNTLEASWERVENSTPENLGSIILRTARIYQNELKYWGVKDFTGGRKHLLLSDFPCIRTTGIGDPDVVLALPISPWRAVFGFKTRETQQFHLGSTPRGLLASRINESSLNRATDRVYSLNEEPRRFLTNRVARPS